MNAPQSLRRVLTGVLAAALTAVTLVAAPAQAQPYPSRLIRIVVPYPPGGAADIVARLNAETNKALQDPATIKKLADLGAVTTPGSPEDFANLIARQTELWSAVIRQAGIRPD